LQYVSQVSDPASFESYITNWLGYVN